ncbi:MAG: glycosyltransferase family 39 protein [Methanobrevibacter sp.]|nr:glycosyltransferase family 39 protein [Methanobrevibacter sp.]
MVKNNNKRVKSNNNINLSRILGISLFGLALISLFIMLICGLNPSVWLDEIFTLNIVTYSFKDMLIATAQDVHPPLYYIIVKMIFSLFSVFSNPLNISDSFNVYIAKLISVLPLICLIYFSFTKLKKEFGWLACGIFTFCIVTMPKMMLYSVEVRMYSWAILFLTLSLYYAYMITKNPNNNKNWIIFACFSLMAAYTHYYAMIGAMMIYFLLIAYMIMKRSSGYVKKSILSIIFSILFYLPWIYMFISYSSYINGNGWWIKPDFQSVIQIVFVLFSPTNIVDNDGFSDLGGLLFFFFLLLSLFYVFLLYDKKDERKTAFLGGGGYLCFNIIDNICSNNFIHS